MSYYCRVERDSVSKDSPRLVSFVVTYPRIVLAEVITHRTLSELWGDLSVCERTTTSGLSKNSASSRAIPISRMIENLKKDPYVPKWTLRQKGMQGRALDKKNPEDQDIEYKVNKIWLESMNSQIKYAHELDDYGIHKQHVNRLLEPWSWITQIITATEDNLNNFFAQRCHKDADPAFSRIARMMFLAMRKSTPVELMYGQWHLPFVDKLDQSQFYWAPFYEEIQDIRSGKKEIPDLIKFSAARCAWISYENHDKEGGKEALLNTWNRLVQEVPVHASPVEHQATPFFGLDESIQHLRSNLTNWLQGRKLLKKERVTVYDPSQEEINSWGME